MIRSIIQPMIRPMITSMVNPNSGRLVYDFDGIDDHISLVSNVSVVSLDTFRFKYKSSVMPSDDYFIDTRDNGGNQFLLINASGNWQFNDVTVTVDNVTVTNGQAFTIADDVIREIEVTFMTSVVISKLFVRDSVSTGHMNGIMFDIVITAVSGGRVMPVDDGFAANPTIATGGIAVNFNEARWVTISV